MEITSLQNPLVKELVRLRQNKRNRLEQGRVLVIGSVVMKELAPWVTPLQVWGPLEEKGSQEIAIHASEGVLKKIAGTTEAPDRIGVYALPQTQCLQGASRLLLLDRVRDPGNLGTLFRTALALGWDGVLLMESCVDPLHHRAVQASKGAVLRLPFQWVKEKELDLWSHKRFLVADLGGEPPQKSESSLPCILVLGNESQGVSPLLKTRGEKVTIPMVGQMESLNVAVAGGILMYCLSKEA